jgi:hypothetical protein
MVGGTRPTNDLNRADHHLPDMSQDALEARNPNLSGGVQECFGVVARSSSDPIDASLRDELLNRRRSSRLLCLPRQKTHSQLSCSGQKKRLSSPTLLYQRIHKLNHRPAGSRWVRQSATSPTGRAEARLAKQIVAAVTPSISSLVDRPADLPPSRCDDYPRRTEVVA